MSFSYVVDPEKRKVVIIEHKENDKVNSMTIGINFFLELDREINKKIFYKEDVISFLENELENENISEDLLYNDKYIDAITELYEEKRFNSDGGDIAVPWTMCLIEAYNEVNPDEYAID